MLHLILLATNTYRFFQPSSHFSTITSTNQPLNCQPSTLVFDTIPIYQCMCFSPCPHSIQRHLCLAGDRLFVRLWSHLCLRRWPPWALAKYINPLKSCYLLWGTPYHGYHPPQMTPLGLFQIYYPCPFTFILFSSPLYTLPSSQWNHFTTVHYMTIIALSLPYNEISITPSYLIHTCNTPFCICLFVCLFVSIHQVSTCWFLYWCTPSTSLWPTLSCGNRPLTDSENGCWKTG